jgi:hypothetical protein
MTTDGIRSIEPLVPIIEQMRVIARDELPAPRSCKIRLWDDDTFDIRFYHSSEDDAEILLFVRTTGEIIWERRESPHMKKTELTGNETIHEPAAVDRDVRVVASLEPPYR